MSKAVKKIGAPFEYLRKTIRYNQLILRLRAQNNLVVFQDEFNVSVAAPEFEFLDSVRPSGRAMLNRMKKFVERPGREVLFRRLIAEFFWTRCIR